MPENNPPLPDFTRWPSFPFEGDLRVKHLAEPVDIEPPRSGEDSADCVACNTPDDSYIWVSERWRVRGMDRPTGLPMVLILECRSHLDIGDLPNLLAAELGVMTVRLERAIRSLDGVARVHVNRWGDGSAHLHMWFLARPYGRLQLRGTFLSLWDDILPVIPEEQWLENLALVAAWLAEFGGRAIAEPPHIHWQSPSTFSNEPTAETETTATPGAWRPANLADTQSAPGGGAAFSESETRDLSATAARAAAIADTAASTATEDAAASAATGDAAASAATADTAASTAMGDTAASTAMGDTAASTATADTAASTAGLNPQPPTPDQAASPPADSDVRGPAAEERAPDEPSAETEAADEHTEVNAAAAEEGADSETAPEQEDEPESDRRAAASVSDAH